MLFNAVVKEVGSASLVAVDFGGNEVKVEYHDISELQKGDFIRLEGDLIKNEKKKIVGFRAYLITKTCVKASFTSAGTRQSEAHAMNVFPFSAKRMGQGVTRHEMSIKDKGNKTEKSSQYILNEQLPKADSNEIYDDRILSECSQFPEAYMQNEDYDFDEDVMALNQDGFNSGGHNSHHNSHNGHHNHSGHHNHNNHHHNHSGHHNSHNNHHHNHNNPHHHGGLRPTFPIFKKPYFPPQHIMPCPSCIPNHPPKPSFSPIKIEVLVRAAQSGSLVVSELRSGRILIVRTPHARHFSPGQKLAIIYDMMTMSNPPIINALDIKRL